MAGRWQQWRRLPAHERRLLLLLAGLQPLLSMSLRVFGYKRTRGWVERWSQADATHLADPQEQADAQRLATLAGIAGRHGPVTSTCLRQALAVYGLLRRRGLLPQLRLGVGRLQGADLDMHAWVELEGQRLAQADARHLAFRAKGRSSSGTEEPPRRA